MQELTVAATLDFMISEGYIRLYADMEASSRERYAIYRL